jgi:bifunctional UDP-N-acetylglucosamine pyrophosphorylase / glucosamine-1-phosphate N-acetyltransferase
MTFATQEEALGTGHALMCSQIYWAYDNILVLNGDMPLITPDLIAELMHEHIQSDAVITFVTAIPDTMHHAYGRVIINDTSIHIVEAKDFTGDTTKPYPINAGIYLFKRSFLEQHASALQPNNVQKQLYITDFIGIASKQGLKVNTITCEYDLVRGVNTLTEFSTVNELMRQKIIIHWLTHGVLIEDPTHTWIDAEVHIAAHTRIGSGTHIRGKTNISSHCVIHPYSIIENSTLAENITVLSHSIISQSTLNNGVQIGPFAHIHSTTTINQNSTIGSFVEIKKSNIGIGTKTDHLSYLVDAAIGDHVTISTGSITCDYDGIYKAKTCIENNSFIGSNTTLVAPLTIGTGAYTAAGSTITQSVPDDTFAISRARQINKPEYAKRIRPMKKIPLNTPSHPTSAFEL